MKSIFNLSKGILSVALISVAFASCSEDTMDNINKDKDHTTSVAAKFIVADVICQSVVQLADSYIRICSQSWIFLSKCNK